MIDALSMGRTGVLSPLAGRSPELTAALARRGHVSVRRRRLSGTVRLSWKVSPQSGDSLTVGGWCDPEGREKKGAE